MDVSAPAFLAPFERGPCDDLQPRESICRCLVEIYGSTIFKADRLIQRAKSDEEMSSLHLQLKLWLDLLSRLHNDAPC
jgi:hypothetical protein